MKNLIEQKVKRLIRFCTKNVSIDETKIKPSTRGDETSKIAR